MLFIQYLQNNGETITLEAIAKPDKVFEDFRGPLAAGLEHENYVTGLIHNIYDAAYSVKDFRTMQFLDWFSQRSPLRLLHRGQISHKV